ncbi:hypothetical protein BGW36DRAFT_401684 [Talaromyces proteolyticus]|uniref:6-methylsalicylate decarboxylase n=1 Tax=Talaromyces proteolyticus TaxID=1131652 RepID=A0AAD4KK74_9EURO|nr:uncharacterized protein BGW36DRAFT_401684 [Talaromyces proteolyticus]KAH8690331.1 hypothetical protein BGW36DRAFT_401684 [Talaromyces proteolyticus]
MTEALTRAGGDPSGLYLDREVAHLIGIKATILSCNQYGAAIRDNNKSRYRFFASVPSLLDTKLALDENSYAFDVLQADGVTLFTRYGASHHYLGHASFRSVWAELNERQAVVFVHPAHPPMYDYPQETGRAAMDLITQGILRDFQQCKIILSHAGGSLPCPIYRTASMLPLMPRSLSLSRDEIPGHVLFGTDFPNAPTEAIKYFSTSLEAYPLSDKVRKEMEFEAALGLFPRPKDNYSS